MLMQIDGTFLFVVISFLIFLFIIKSILFSPISKILDEREKFYAKNLKMESESKEKSKNLLEQKDLALKESKKQAGEIVKQASQEAKSASALEIKQTKQEVQNLVELNKQNLEQEAKTAKSEIKKELNSIVNTIVSKVLREDLNINLSDEKINKYLNI